MIEARNDLPLDDVVWVDRQQLDYSSGILCQLLLYRLTGVVSAIFEDQFAVIGWH